MNLTRFEKLVLLGCPWLFGTILIISGILTAGSGIGKLCSVLLICSGFICMSLYCVCALIIKLIEKRQVA